MPHVVTHAMNPNAIMCAACDTHVLASQPSLSIHDAPELLICMACMHAKQLLLMFSSVMY